MITSEKILCRIVDSITEEPTEAVTERVNDIVAISACSNCKSILRSMDTIRRADGNALQLVTCCECNHKWKEYWVR